VSAFERIAIVNRGEPAMRLIRAVRELRQAGGPAYRTIALYTDPDERALFVREADEAVRLGPPIVTDPITGERRIAYLDYSILEAALVESRADAAWVGWGFVAEQVKFAELCERLGIVFVGPSPSATRLLGDKIAAKQLADSCSIPVGAWSGGPVTTLDQALPHARRIGFPLMVKSSAGGGGRGVRLVRDEAGLEGALAAAGAEAVAAFGDPCIFLEEYVPRARHVEVQVICDGAGGAWALGVRDCSVQRRYQKVIEESASTCLGVEMDHDLRAAALRLCAAAGYRGAGTVEFLFDPTRQAASFLEVNARLQVEHTVTEATTGIDLVKLQLHVAAGGRLESSAPVERGHAVEVRLCAEDPTNDFAPSPGVVDQLGLPGGPGIRVDSGVIEGDAIPPEFDSMIAKIVAWGSDRGEALARLERAVDETRVAIRGGCTNRAFLLRLLRHPDLRHGAVDVGWVERSVGGRGDPDAAGAHIALVMAAVEMYDEELGVEQSQFLASAARGRPQMAGTVGRTVELRHRGQQYRVMV
jgi:acetyl/propionyl-CoA carboxylase alpha subunit